MTLNLDDLERVAKAATPGPWRVEGFVKRGGAIAKIISHGLNAQGDGPAGYVGDTYGEADAKFVAALNPAVCLALISRARGAERLEEMLALTQELWGLNNELDDALDDERPALERAIKKASKRLSALNEGGPANG